LLVAPSRSASYAANASTSGMSANRCAKHRALMELHTFAPGGGLHRPRCRKYEARLRLTYLPIHGSAL